MATTSGAPEFIVFNARSPRLFFALLLTLLLQTLSFGARAEDFLDPAEAFRFSAQVVGSTDSPVIEVRYRIVDGYYLYRERFQFSADGDTRLGAPAFPAGKVKFDVNFQKNVETYRKDVVVRIPILRASAPFTLHSTAQGCADAGLCYPPQEATASLSPVPVATAVTSTSAGVDPDDSRIAAALRGGNLFAIVAVFAGLGLLLSFTPCMLPMVPILSSIIVGHGEHVTRARGFTLALAYTLGMALIYTAMGVAAGLAGEGLAAALQTPWMLGGFATLMLLFALSMFGVYDLQMPRAVQAWFAQRSGNIHGGRLASVFAMGALSALIVGPCVAAPLAGVLLYISQTRNVIIGGVALFSLAIGMGLPLLALGLSAGALLPRAGSWMDAVKHFFGVVLIGAAIWMVTPVIPVWTQMLAWAALFVMIAVFLRVFDPLPPDAERPARFGKGLGVLALLAGVALMAGVASGGRDVLRPLAHLWGPGAATAATAPNEVRFERVRNVAELDARLARSDRPVMLDFYADWCVSCKEMERLTYTDPRVAARMAGLTLLQVDVTANSDDDKALLKRFNLFGPPGILFFDPKGQLIDSARVIGYKDADQFLSVLRNIAS